MRPPLYLKCFYLVTPISAQRWNANFCEDLREEVRMVRFAMVRVLFRNGSLPSATHWQVWAHPVSLAATQGMFRLRGLYFLFLHLLKCFTSVGSHLASSENADIRRLLR